ncbi:unnamed protein product [Rhizopus stolonifer]
MSNTPRILTVGTGAIGAIYSWRLAQSCEITTICRSNYKCVAEKGFEMDTVKFGKGIFHPCKVARTVSECENESFDYVLVTLKALPEVYNIPDMIAPVIKNEHTTIVLIQNGLGIEDPFVERFPNNPMISIVAFIGASQHQPGRITMTGDESLVVGKYSKAKKNSFEQQSKFVEYLKMGDVNVQVVDDIEQVRWQKLLWTACFSPICTLTGMNTTQVLENEEAIRTVRRLMHDVIVAAGADGYHFDEKKQIENMFAKTKETSQNYKPSMQLDKERGNPMEIEVILGTALKRAKAKGLSVPQLEMLHSICSVANNHILSEVSKI